MSAEKPQEEKIEQILKVLDDTIAKEVWQESNFLRMIGKKLKELRQQFVEDVYGPIQDKSRHEAHLANRIAARAGLQEIFILLYASDGRQLSAWERILNNLPAQLVSRPIYELEDDVKKAIRARDAQTNEAYVAAYISKSDIIPTPPEKTPKGRLGTDLLTLKDRALTPDNITRLVHISGTYRFENGKLLPEDGQ